MDKWAEPVKTNKIEDVGIARRTVLIEWLTGLELIVVNREETPTFVRGSSISHYDVISTLQRVAQNIIDRTMMNEKKDNNSSECITRLYP